MSNKITFKEWLVNFFKGVWQVLCWIGRAFNPKYKSVFGRVCWAAITLCVIAFTIMIGKAWYHEFYERPYHRADHQRISANLTFSKPSYSDKPGWIQNHQTGAVITKNIDWITISSDEDSLMVFSQKGKRGYINRFNGKISIPARYDKAWVFSEGMAAVADKDSVFFIDHSGNPINERKFRYNAKTRGYVYHGDLCAIAIDGGLMGLIDRDGNWAVQPEYDWIVSECNNFWRMRKGDSHIGLWYAFNDKGEQVTETGYPILEISKDLGIVATLPNHLQVAYGFDGTKSDNFLVRDIEEMTYNKSEWDENGEREVGIATLMRYRMPDGHEGLCTVGGDIVTEPVYWEIQPISKDTYLCTYKDTQAGVVINSKGEIVKHENS
ncbi:MAG: WG repeat-containing protein [Muribaculaceae bacterium]